MLNEVLFFSEVLVLLCDWFFHKKKTFLTKKMFGRKPYYAHLYVVYKQSPDAL